MGCYFLLFDCNGCSIRRGVGEKGRGRGERERERERERGYLFVFFFFFFLTMIAIYKVSGEFDLTAVTKEPLRSINWHAEKHITKQRDNLLLRLENVISPPLILSFSFLSFFIIIICILCCLNRNMVAKENSEGILFHLERQKKRKKKEKNK